MASEIVGCVMQTLYKNTTVEALIIRQAVNAILVAKDLLPPTKAKGMAERINQNNQICSAVSNTKHLLQECLCSCSAASPTPLPIAQSLPA